MHDPYLRHYEFLPSREDKLHTENSPLAPRIANGLRDLAEIVISKEAMETNSPWQTRLQIHAMSGGDQDIPRTTSDVTYIANNYIGHQETAFGQRRVFQCDRSLANSTLGATRLRLEIDAKADARKEDYLYAITTYRPTITHNRPPHTNESGSPVLFPHIDFSTIRSRFLCSPSIDSSKKAPLIRVATYDPTHTDEAMARSLTSISAPDFILEAAYARGRWPEQTNGQKMLGALGARALMHHMLSHTLRHLATTPVHSTA